jgi:hypothetical protein
MYITSKNYSAPKKGQRSKKQKLFVEVKRHELGIYEIEQRIFENI